MAGGGGVRKTLRPGAEFVNHILYLIHFITIFNIICGIKLYLFNL